MRCCKHPFLMFGVDYPHVVCYSFGRQSWLHSVIHWEYWKSIIHVTYTIDFQYSQWITECNAYLGVNIAWGSIPFQGWHRLRVSRLGVKTAWGFAVWESTLFEDPKLPLNFGVILGVIFGGFFRKGKAAFGERAISAIVSLYLYRSLDVKQAVMCQTRVSKLENERASKIETHSEFCGEFAQSDIWNKHDNILVIFKIHVI